jgi:hypothetical protein
MLFGKRVKAGFNEANGKQIPLIFYVASEITFLMLQEMHSNAKRAQ